MGYIEKTLLPDEVIVYRTRLHWIAFLRPSFSLLLAFLVFFLGGPAVGWLLDVLQADGQLSVDEPLIRTYADYAAMILGGIWALLALPGFVKVAIRWATSEFVVTNRKVVVKLGLVARTSTELMLPKIESVGVKQSILGRMLDYGSVVLTGTGATHEPFVDISHPLEFRRQTQAQLYDRAPRAVV